MRDEVIDDGLAEALLEVHDVVADAELAGHAPRVVDVLDAAALLLARELGGARFGPEAHGDTDDLEATGDKERGGDGAIDAAGHADDHAGAIHRCVTISIARAARADALGRQE